MRVPFLSRQLPQPAFERDVHPKVPIKRGDRRYTALFGGTRQARRHPTEVADRNGCGCRARLMSSAHMQTGVLGTLLIVVAHTLSLAGPEAVESPICGRRGGRYIVEQP